MYSKAYLVAVHDANMFDREMLEKVRSALIFEQDMDSFVFRVVYGTLPGAWVDFHIPVDTDRDYYFSGYNDIEFNKVISTLFSAYKLTSTPR